MLLTRAWNRLYELARELGVVDTVKRLIEKRPNAVHSPEESMRALFIGFMQALRVYHIPLKDVPAHVATYYRDMGRCTRESYDEMRRVIESFYLRTRKYRKVKITIDGTFVGLDGKTFEHSSKMYSGNKKDKGKKGYTITTCFDTVNKSPACIDVPLIHELQPMSALIRTIMEWEQHGEIIIELVVLDALYLGQDILDTLAGHKYIIRAPAHDWLVKYVDEVLPSGSKPIDLWGHRVILHWRLSKDPDKKYDLLLTNTNYKRVWQVYGHNKQMVENYHNDLKNRFGIRKLPSRKYHAILVYFCMIILIYMLVRALLLGLSMNRISCGLLLYVISQSSSWKNVVLNLSKLGLRMSKFASSLLKPG